MCSILYPGPQCSRLGHVLANIQALLANLHWFSVYSICHDANSVAHALARYVKHISSYVFWIEDSPPSLLWRICISIWLIYGYINYNLVRFQEEEKKKKNQFSTKLRLQNVESRFFLLAQHQQVINPFIFFLFLLYFVFSSSLSSSAWPQVKFTLFTLLLVLPNITPPIFISPSIHPHGHGLDKLKWKWADNWWQMGFNIYICVYLCVCEAKSWHKQFRVRPNFEFYQVRKYM